MRYYNDYDEREAYEKGRHDYESGRKDYDYDKYSGRSLDEAYFKGMEDQERETRRRLEEERQREEEEQFNETVSLLYPDKR